MLVAYLTSLESLNGKTHAGTGIPQLSQSLKLRKRAQHDAFGHPTGPGGAGTHTGQYRYIRSAYRECVNVNVCMLTSNTRCILSGQ